MNQLILSLFPGIGLLDMAFEETGFCVVRGPDVLWGGDVKRFYPPAGRFDGVIGGPPCQAFSSFRAGIESQGDTIAENLIPEYERCICEAAPAWFLMENVPAAPEPNVAGYAVFSFLLNNRWVGGVQNRVRRFSLGMRGSRSVDLRRWLEVALFEDAEWGHAVLAGGCPSKHTRQAHPQAIKGPSWATVREGLRLQGLPEDYFGKEPAFTGSGAQRMIGNGVPLPMGRAITKAVKEALQL